MILSGDFEDIKKTTELLNPIMSISYEPLQKVLIHAIKDFGTKEKLETSYKVWDVLYHMLKHKNQIPDDNVRAQWIELLIGACYLHNLFYDGTLVSIFKVREKVAPLAREYNVPINAIAALFQAVESQLGSKMPVESCIPNDSSPNGLFAMACWFVEDYQGDRKIPECGSQE